MTIELGDSSGNRFLTDVVTQGSSLAALNSALTTQLRGQALASIKVTGIGTMTLIFEVTTDNTNWDNVEAYPVGGGAPVLTTTANGAWNVPVASFFAFRVRCSAFTSGTAIVSVVASQGAGFPPASTAGIPVLDLTRWAGTALGTPTNFGTTPGVVVAGSVNASVFIGTTVATAAAAGIQKVGISGNAGASVDAVSGAAVPANGLLVGGGSIAGGTNLTPFTVKAASTAAAATDTSLVVQALIGNVVMVTAAAGIQKVGISGNAGASLDAVSGAAVPANGLFIGGGSVAGATNLTPITVKAASVAAAATDTSLVVQPLVGNAVMATAAAGVQKVGIVGNANAAFDGAIAAVPPANALQIAPKAATANPANATAGNAVALLATLAGSLVTTPLNNRTLVKHQPTAVAVTTETTIITAGGAGVFNDLVCLIVTTASATAGTLTIRDVTAAGTPWILNYPNAAIGPGSPLIIPFGDVPLQQGTAASAWTITNSQAVAINVTAQYVQRLA